MSDPSGVFKHFPSLTADAKTHIDEDHTWELSVKYNAVDSASATQAIVCIDDGTGDCAGCNANGAVNKTYAEASAIAAGFPMETH